MLTKNKFQQLRQEETKHSVSIYIPTEIKGDYEKNRILWKNACNEAKHKLEKSGLENTSFLNPAFELIDNVDFWAHQTRGLAGFYSSAGTAKTIHLNNTRDEVTFVGDKFHLAPLLKELMNEDRVFILALSKKETRFFEAVQSGIYPVFIHDVVVKDMEEALNIDEAGNHLQHHSAGGNKAIHHGSNAGLDKEEVRVKQYIRRVDDGIMEIIHDERVPLVLASVEEYHPIYREVTKYNHFSDHLIAGNPESLSPRELREQINPFFEEIRAKRIKEFEEKHDVKSREKLTCHSLDELEKSAKFKNIESVLVTQQYINNLSEEDTARFNDIALAIYDQGGSLLVTQNGETELEDIHALNRFEMHLQES